MRALVAAAVVVSVTLLFGASSRAAAPTDRIWFAPGPGTLDYVQLFENPEQWPHARQLFDVFKFYQQHTQLPPPSSVGPNSYTALANAGVFRTLNGWGKKTAIEVGAVKDFYCTPDASGMQSAVSASVQSVQAIQSAGGTVTYLAMDDPFAAGQAPVCGGPALEPTADRIATYFTGVTSGAPSVKIGWIEAYPLAREPDIERAIALLNARGVHPAFLHMDFALNGVKVFRTDFAADMTRLKSVCASAGIPFGIIVWGSDGDADALYALGAERVMNAITDAFPSWDALPDQIIVQSWAQTSTGLRITPSNLPESRSYTHTNLLWQFYRRLRGQTGSSSGTALAR